MSNITLSDAEIKTVGMNRWAAKNSKRFLGIVFGGVAVAFGAVRLAANYPKTPVGFFLALAVMAVMIFTYIRFVNNPQKKAGEEFLKEYRS
jgi:uncharacterized membrane protein